MRLSRFILAFVIVLGMAGCDTFADLVPGITAAKAEIAETQSDLADATAKLTLLQTDLEAVITAGIVDSEAAEVLLARFEAVELDVAEVDTKITEVGESVAQAEEAAIELDEAKADPVEWASAGAELAGYFGVPGMGVLSLVLNGLRRRANTRTAAVVTTVEANRNGDGTIDWAAVREAQEAAGVHEAVRAIRKAEAAKIAAAKAAISVT